MDILSGSALTDSENFINTTAIFGGVQRTILSKEFKGGKIRNFFSSTELDFTQADIDGIVELDISQAFGEITIAVPADWRVEADLAHICSVVDEDRAYERRGFNSKKVLLLKGLSIFAVVDVVNFM
jgi:predicted membrane protein